MLYQVISLLNFYFFFPSSYSPFLLLCLLILSILLLFLHFFHQTNAAEVRVEDLESYVTLNIIHFTFLFNIYRVPFIIKNFLRFDILYLLSFILSPFLSYYFFHVFLSLIFYFPIFLQFLSEDLCVDRQNNSQCRQGKCPRK